MKKSVFLGVFRCLLLIGLLFPLLVKGQDIHFSQFFHTPVYQNPAHAGNFVGDYRFNAAQRTQWRSVSDNPYNTIMVAADARDFLQQKELGVMALLYHDITGDSRFRTVKLNLGASYGFRLKDSLSRISGGVQVDITHRSLNYDDLNFGSQYNGIYYDPSLGNGENFQRQSRFYFDAGMGLLYNRRDGFRKIINGGFALFNIIAPKQSFFNNDEVKLDRRWLIHADAVYPVADLWDVSGSIQYMQQGSHQEFLIGAGARYVLKDERGLFRAIKASIHYRNKDAGYLMVGMDYDQWTGGISYDLNISNLTPASRYRGGFEFTLIYRLEKFKGFEVPYRKCPVYI